MAKNDLPRLVIFGDHKKPQVAEAIGEFEAFAKGKARIVASSHIDE